MKHAPVPFFPPNFQIGLLWTGRIVLWTAALLAVLGLFWRPAMSLSRTESGLATLALTLWAAALLFLLRRPGSGQSVWNPTLLLVRNGALPIPILLLAALLPFPWFLVYLPIIGLLEYSLQRRAGRRRDKTVFHGLDTETPLVIGDEEAFEESLDGNTTQHIVRTRTEAGTDRFEGTFLIEFLDRQGTAGIHIPFCPAFGSVPRIEAFLLDEEAAKIAAMTPHPYGVRIDVKREPAAASRFHIAVVAEADASKGKAAGSGLIPPSRVGDPDD